MGCSTLPSPSESIPAPNGQVRLTEARGAVEGGYRPLFGGGAEGTSCIATFLGELPPRIAGTLTQGGCVLTIEPGAP